MIPGWGWLVIGPTLALIFIPATIIVTGLDQWYINRRRKRGNRN